MSWVRLFAVVMGIATAIAQTPDMLSDKNSFLADFLDNDLLSVLGFISAVTLASIANIHLQLNAIEERSTHSFAVTRHALRKSALTLIILFGLAFLIVVIKPIFAVGLGLQGLFNGAAMVVVYINLDVMWDITSATFNIPSLKKRP